MKLTREGCRQRQQRLLASMAEKGLDGAIISRREYVYYFTGFLHDRYQAAAAFIAADGKVTLVGAEVPEGVAVDEVIPYSAARHATLHSRQCEAVAEKLARRVPKGKRLGTDLGGGVACIAALAGPQVQDLTGELVRLRQCKLPDEIDAIRAAIDITEALYSAAKVAIHPGADELEVFAYLRAEATRAAGEDLEYLGSDFQANSPGGPARRRRMEAGELYILDVGLSLHGYFADNCRTFAVDRSPSQVQWRAWEVVDGLFAELEAAVRPGVEAAAVYRLADQRLREAGFGGLIHHLGHGIGLWPHEAPQLNPEYDAVFAAGNLFTLEPGVYAEELKAGIRLEENYLLTDTGVERLTSFPRTLI